MPVTPEPTVTDFEILVSMLCIGTDWHQGVTANNSPTILLDRLGKRNSKRKISCHLQCWRTCLDTVMSYKNEAEILRPAYV